MILLELRDKADAVLATFWKKLVIVQDKYYEKHGKYFQLLISPTNSAVDGFDSDFTVRHPSDEVHTIDVDFAWTEKIPFQIEVGNFERHDTVGFRATVWIELLNGDIYTRERIYTKSQDDVTQDDGGWRKLQDIWLQ